ncbi:DUF411 domain-containing protein [Aestuariirhabdus litorea]|uniref:DUF411 domain-containing protein n=1 Tax=Aestuariirhabdus litorea TaxID=2528527 RepID=A0A3P3VN42_9GAMM|nr:DUF411 domain-containing protein [Aestuariirhabdus litorea]RRJ84020.1 DUF411 domain-containing protein [Aestuariirhabdus litorea]RWW97240.1 DUF411 domain-containing protein [Endozoicomonadaceae bacterium GTF-13]
MTIRKLLGALVAAVLLPLSITPAAAESRLPLMTVYKSPTCGCCGDWVKHMEANGFEVQVHDTDNLNPIKLKAGLTPALASCHTAFIDGYVVEGHVPASDVKRMLSERPAIKGISAPGMPVGSPGMEMGDRVDPYEVVSFDEKGNARLYQSYP